MSTGNSCQAKVLFLGIEMGECGDRAEGLFSGACVHEHVKQRRLCAFHAGSPSGFCADCYDIPGPDAHECPVVIVRVPESATA